MCVASDMMHKMLQPHASLIKASPRLSANWICRIFATKPHFSASKVAFLCRRRRAFFLVCFGEKSIKGHQALRIWNGHKDKGFRTSYCFFYLSIFPLKLVRFFSAGISTLIRKGTQTESCGGRYPARSSRYYPVCLAQKLITLLGLLLELGGHRIKTLNKSCLHPDQFLKSNHLFQDWRLGENSNCISWRGKKRKLRGSHICSFPLRNQNLIFFFSICLKKKTFLRKPHLLVSVAVLRNQNLKLLSSRKIGNINEGNVD